MVLSEADLLSRLLIIFAVISKVQKHTIPLQKRIFNTFPMKNLKRLKFLFRVRGPQKTNTHKLDFKTKIAIFR